MSLQGNKFKLSNGTTIPAIAYGAGTKWFKYGQEELNELAINSISYALGHGFVHVDGAMIYGTDRELGAALSTVDRSSVFVTNKYVKAVHHLKTPYENPYEGLKDQLKDMKTDYVDLYLLHLPFISKETDGFDLKEAWEYMEKLLDEGYAKAIGVSNFAVEDLKIILDSGRIKPVVNQIEFNAYLQNQTPGIVNFCKENDILVEAYSPLAPLFQTEAGELGEYVDELASKYSKTAGQVLLRWVLQNGILPVTTSANETRITQLCNLFDFELTAEEVSHITEIGKKHPTLRLYWKEQYSRYD